VTEPEAKTQFASWKTPQIPLEIEYSLSAMEEIRASACAALRELPAGEREVGGVLFGEHLEHSIRILTWRPIVCQYSEGPSLRLVARDRVELACLLELARRTEDLMDLQPVGWFVSHPRTGVALCTSDLEVYQSFFPYAWQTTLVLQPARDGRARCGFFVRGTSGVLKSDASYREFDLKPMKASAPAAAESVSIFSWAAGAASPEPAKDRKPSADVKDKAAHHPARASTRTPAASLHYPEDRPWAVRFGWLWVIAILLVIGAGWFLVKPRSAPHFEPFSLHVVGSGGTVQVEWDRNAPLMQQARSAVVDIRDGGKSTRYSLSPDEIHAGVLSYVRQTRDLNLVMTVYPPTGAAVQGAGRLIVPADVPPDAAADKAGATPAAPSADTTELRAERDALRAQVAELEDSVRKEAAEKNRLEGLVRILENRLNITSDEKTKPSGNQNK
jgi:hypothetical protein